MYVSSCSPHNMCPNMSIQLLYHESVVAGGNSDANGLTVVLTKKLVANTKRPANKSALNVLHIYERLIRHTMQRFADRHNYMWCAQ